MSQSNHFPVLFLLIAFILSSCTEKASMPGKSFEGKIVQQITVDGSGFAPRMEKKDSFVTAPTPSPKSPMGSMGLNATITMYVHGDKVRYDMEMLGGLVAVRSIIDRNARTLTVLAAKHAYVTNLRSTDSIRSKVNDSINAHSDLLDSLDQMLPKPTGNKQTING
jgi:hypothetical protein